jgi:two-component system sensor histidine kinase KdpD
MDQKWPAEAHWIRGFVAAAVLVVVAIGIGAVLRRLPHANLSLLFLLAVLVVAAVWGLWPSIFASALSFLALNFFFTTPLYTFTIEEEGDLASIVFFLAMAALTANLASRMRNEMAANQAALGRVSMLLDFSRRMAGAARADEALTALVEALGGVAQAGISAWLPDERGAPVLAAAHPPESRPVASAALRKAWDGGSTRAETRGEETLLPLTTAGGRVGLIAIAGAPLSDRQRQFADGLCEQASLAVERIVLVDSLKKAQLANEAEQMRSALLSSVSHDLRTPLASIIGSVSSVLEYGDILKPADQRELLKTVLAESQRLNRYIQNLLDMTRLGRGHIELRRDWVDLNDLISAAMQRLSTALAGLDVRVDVAAGDALIHVHGELIEQLLVNVLDNAADFSEPGDRIDVKAYKQGDSIVVEIVDQGPGIDPGERERVFDMFYSTEQGDRRRHGVGLGLAICKSIVAAHGGTIAAETGPGGKGTCVRIGLPTVENAAGVRHG